MWARVEGLGLAVKMADLAQVHDVAASQEEHSLTREWVLGFPR